MSLKCTYSAVVQILCYYSVVKKRIRPTFNMDDMLKNVFSGHLKGGNTYILLTVIIL